MYLDYWELAAKPFEPQLAGGDFYFPSESHEGALSKLRYAVQQGRGVAALAGPSGAGKTLLIDRLAESIDPETSPLVRVGFPQLSTRELLAYLAEKLQAPAVSANATGAAEESIRRLELLAEQNSEKGRRPVVVIDEAHLLEDSGALETIRLLDNFRSGCCWCSASRSTCARRRRSAGATIFDRGERARGPRLPSCWWGRWVYCLRSPGTRRWMSD